MHCLIIDYTRQLCHIILFIQNLPTQSALSGDNWPRLQYGVGGCRKAGTDQSRYASGKQVKECCTIAVENPWPIYLLQPLSVRGRTLAFLLDVHRLCGAIEGDWAIFCHAGSGQVGRVRSVRGKSLEILRHIWVLVFGAALRPTPTILLSLMAGLSLVQWGL